MIRRLDCLIRRLDFLLMHCANTHHTAKGIGSVTHVSLCMQVAWGGRWKRRPQQEIIESFIVTILIAFLLKIILLGNNLKYTRKLHEWCEEHMYIPHSESPIVNILSLSLFAPPYTLTYSHVYMHINIYIHYFFSLKYLSENCTYHGLLSPNSLRYTS